MIAIKVKKFKMLRVSIVPHYTSCTESTFITHRIMYAHHQGYPSGNKNRFRSVQGEAKAALDRACSRLVVRLLNNLGKSQCP